MADETVHLYPLGDRVTEDRSLVTCSREMGLADETGHLIDGPVEDTRVHESWWWERPNGAGDLGYNRPAILRRCAAIWGGRVKVIRQITHDHHPPRRAGGGDRG